MRCTEPVEVFVEGRTPALRAGASVETTIFWAILAFGYLVGLGFDKLNPADTADEHAYSTNGLLLKQDFYPSA